MTTRFIMNINGTDMCINDDITIWNSYNLLGIARELLFSLSDELPQSLKSQLQSFCLNQIEWIVAAEVTSEHGSYNTSDSVSSASSLNFDEVPCDDAILDMTDSELINALLLISSKNIPLNTNVISATRRYLCDNRSLLVECWEDIAYRMFKDGNSVKFIADSLSLSVGTIEDTIRYKINHS